MSEVLLMAECNRSLAAQSGPPYIYHFSLSLTQSCAHSAHSASAGISPLPSAYDLTGTVCLTLFSNQYNYTLLQPG